MVFRKRPPVSPFRQCRRIGVARSIDILQPRSGGPRMARGVSPWNSGAQDVQAAERRHESRDRAPRRSFVSRGMHIVFARLVSPLPGLRSWLSSRSRGSRPWLLWVAPSGAGEPGSAFSKSTSIARVDSTRRRRQVVPRARFPDEPKNSLGSERQPGKQSRNDRVPCVSRAPFGSRGAVVLVMMVGRGGRPAFVRGMDGADGTAGAGKLDDEVVAWAPSSA